MLGGVIFFFGGECQGCLLLGTNKLGAGLRPGMQGPEHSLTGQGWPCLLGKTFCQDPSAPENPVGNSDWSVLDSVEAFLALGTCYLG